MILGRWIVIWRGFREWQEFGTWSYPQTGDEIGFKIFDAWLLGPIEIRRMT